MHKSVINKFKAAAILSENSVLSWHGDDDAIVAMPTKVASDWKERLNRFNVLKVGEEPTIGEAYFVKKNLKGYVTLVRVLIGEVNLWTLLKAFRIARRMGLGGATPSQVIKWRDME